MQTDRSLMTLALGLMLMASCEGFFLKWGSDPSRQSVSQKPWLQQLAPNMSPAFRYYSYNPYESRKMYQMSPYAQPEMPYGPSMAPIPISVPAGASLTPVSLQHVQLVPCMCPVASEEADKLQEAGPGPYLAQTLPQYAQQVNDPAKAAVKQ